jgi:hypothetical protein
MAAQQNKTEVPGMVEEDKNNSNPKTKKYKIKKSKASESELTIELLGTGNYKVKKLSTDGLPEKFGTQKIRWFNSFAVMLGDAPNEYYINEDYYITLPKPDTADTLLVIFDGNGDPYLYNGTGKFTGDTIKFTDGDPAAGWVP